MLSCSNNAERVCSREESDRWPERRKGSLPSTVSYFLFDILLRQVLQDILIFLDLQYTVLKVEKEKENFTPHQFMNNFKHYESPISRILNAVSRAQCIGIQGNLP
jgi:hypothetical protein